MRMFQLATVPAREAGSHRLAASLYLHDAFIPRPAVQGATSRTPISRGLDEYSRAEAARHSNPAETCTLLLVQANLALSAYRAGDTDPSTRRQRINSESSAAVNFA